MYMDSLLVYSKNKEKKLDKTKSSQVRMVVVMKLVETCLARVADPANGMTYHAVCQQNI